MLTQQADLYSFCRFLVADKTRKRRRSSQVITCQMLRDSTNRLKGAKEMWGPQPPWIQPGVVHSKVGLGNGHLPGLFGSTGMKDMMICEKDWFIMDIGGANGTIVAHQWAGFLMGSSEVSFWENGFEMWRFLIWGQSWDNILQTTLSTLILTLGSTKRFCWASFFMLFRSSWDAFSFSIISYSIQDLQPYMKSLKRMAAQAKTANLMFSKKRQGHDDDKDDASVWLLNGCSQRFSGSKSPLSSTWAWVWMKSMKSLSEKQCRRDWVEAPRPAIAGAEESAAWSWAKSVHPSFAKEQRRQVWCVTATHGICLFQP